LRSDLHVLGAIDVEIHPAGFNGTVEYAGFDGTWPDVDTAYQPIPYVMEPYDSGLQGPGSGVCLWRAAHARAAAITGHGGPARADEVASK
jgi:hypothetical protein